jgi:hypothetical protein
MRLRKNCSAWLGLAGACLFVIGCGSDVPDPESDSQAAAGSAPPGAGAAAPAPAVAAAAAPTAPAVAAADAPKAQEAAPADAPPAQAEAPKEQPKAQGGGTTAEMLALAGGNNPTPPSEAAPGAPGAAAPAPPAGAPPNAGPGARGGGMAQMQAPGGAGGPGGGMMGRMTPPPGAQAQDPSKQMAAMNQNMMKMRESMGNRGTAGGGPGAMPGMAAGGAGVNKVDEGPADTNSPRGAVKTFLNALKAKDADRLSEATAQRAARDSSGKNQEIFTKILEVSLSDTELDDLAKKLEGYQITGENPPKSTGRVDVVVQKSGDNGAYFRRRITARREKKGWGVLDISPEQKFAAIGAIRRKTR